MNASPPEIAAPLRNPAPLPSPTSRWAVVSLALSMLLASLGTSIANVSLPTLSRAFSASFQEVQWVVLAYLLAVTSLVVSIGRLGDLLGRRRLLLGSLLLFSIASLLCALAPTLLLLIAARAAQGIGAAAMMALSVAFVGDTLPKHQAGRGMGLLGTTSAVGTALGPSLGGLLLGSWSWRAIFLLHTTLGVLTWLLARSSLPRRPSVQNPAREGFAYAGTLILAMALTAYALAMTVNHGRFGALNGAFLVLAAGLGALFAFRERRTTTPLLRLPRPWTLGLKAGLLTGGLVSTVIMTTLVVGPFYLSLALKLDAAAVGLILSAGPLVAALAGVPAGRLTDRIGESRVTLFGLAAMEAGTLMLALLRPPQGVVGYLVPILTITLGYALFQTANGTGVMRGIADGTRGVVSGLLNLSRNLGLISGAAVMGTVFAFASHTTEASRLQRDDWGTGLRLTFAFAAVLIGVAGVIALRTRSPRPAFRYGTS